VANGSDSDIALLAEERACRGNGADPLNQDALAQDFADAHCDVLRYVPEWGRWYRFDGTCWRKDTTLAAVDLVRDMVRARADAVQRTGIKSAANIYAVEKLARSDRRIAAAPEQWDADPWLITAGGATYDLRTGEGRNADPEDHITKSAGCPIAPTGTPHPIWAAFLERVLPDLEVRDFLQRYAGYCLTGCTSEHAFAFCYGTGANGKSTFINTIAKAFGDYAATAVMSAFLASQGEQHPTDLAGLHGARLVVAQEVQSGRSWDESKIKAITGGDPITARFMRQDFFSYMPTFKLLIAGNHKPRIGSVDEAMRRRLLIIPFAVQVPLLERDHALMDKLELELPAILRWAMDGCMRWQAMGLSPPASVLAATNDYFGEQDIVGQWIEDCTQDAGPRAFTRTSALFASWRTWCEERNLKPGSTMRLMAALVERGYARGREPSTGQKGLIGIAIKAGP
jgi:putative DNA primase/helicase